MDKMRMESVDITAKNIEKIRELFPNVTTESCDKSGKVKNAINFDLLRQMLSSDVLEGDEAFEFTWVGKKAAIVEAGKPIQKTLRPCKEESKDWDTTGNMYIEGDNLDVLKLMQESYLDKVKMIYIDPPYNTGKDFIYHDSFYQTADAYNIEAGTYDDSDNKLFQNTSSNGRFHSDWCSMIFSRLSLAKNLLAKEGAIFISIDDSEHHSLKKICDEVFGEKNFICIFCRKGSGGRQDSKYYAVVHEYVLCYAKSITDFISGKEIKEGEIFPFYDSKLGKHYKTQLLRKWGENSRRSDRPNLYYPITDPDGNDFFPMVSVEEEGCWRWSKEKMQVEIRNNRVEFRKKGDSWVAYEKIFEPEEGNPNTKLYTTWLDDIGNSTGASLLKELLGSKIFGYPKPVELIEKLLTLGNTSDGDIILDFFSGSATTAHAVMQLNAEEGGNRKFIMVQLQEECSPDSEAFKAGYKNICEIGKERIHRAGGKIKEEAGLTAQNLDIGFRVFKLDSSNMKDVYYSATEYTQTKLDDLTSNIKEDRTELDLLFGCLLEWGLPLSMPYTSEEINGVTIHTYNDGDLIACFAEKVSENVIREIAKRQPLRAVFRDSSFASSPAKINVEEIFKLIAPNTSVKVL